MDRDDPVFAPLFTRRKPRRRKATRAELRKLIAGKKRQAHGGRGKKYGLKSKKRRRRHSVKA